MCVCVCVCATCVCADYICVLLCEVEYVIVSMCVYDDTYILRQIPKNKYSDFSGYCGIDKFG